MPPYWPPWESTEHTHSRRLARAVGPEEAENLPAAHAERDVVHGRECAETLREAFHLDYCFFCHFKSVVTCPPPPTPEGARSYHVSDKTILNARLDGRHFHPLATGFNQCGKRTSGSLSVFLIKGYMQHTPEGKAAFHLW